MTKKSNRTTNCLVFLSLMVLTLVVGISFYQKISNTPKKYFIEAITSLKNDYKYIYNDQNSNYEFVNNDFTYDGNLSFNIEPNFLEFIKLKNTQNILSNIDFLNNIEIDYTLLKKESQILFNINNKHKENNLNFSYYFFDNNHYFKLEQFSDEYFKINNIFDFITDKVIYIEEADYLINFMVKSFANNLDDNYFSKVKEQIVINNEILTVDKNVLTLDRKNTTEILNNILSDLKEDDKATKIIKKYYPEFENLNIEISDNLDNDIVLYFNTYISNNNLIKYEFEINNINKILDIMIKDITVSFIKDSKDIEISIDKKRVAYIDTEKVENGYNLGVSINDNKIGNISASNLETEKKISINTETLPNNNFSLTLSEIFDKNVLEDYDKIENKLLIDYRLLGFNLLKLEILNISNIYDYANIEVSFENFNDISNLKEENFKQIIDIIKDFVLLQEN